MTVRIAQPALALREELNALRNQVGQISASITELNYMVGVTSSVQTQLDGAGASWTPVLADASTGGNESATVGVGLYYKIGKLVVIDGSFTDIDTSGLTGGNAVHVTGFPFTCAVGDRVTLTWNNIVTGTDMLLVAGISVGGSYFRLQKASNNAGAANCLVSNLTTGVSDLKFTAVYQTND